MGNAERARTVRQSSGGSSLRVVVAAALGVGVLTTGSGCVVAWLASMAASSDQYYRQVQQAIDALPTVNVRIVNETEVEATVYLASAIKPPTTPPEFGPMLYPYDGGEYLESADEKSVRVVGGGTATGALKCGETIGISATAGGNPGYDDIYYYSDYSYMSGLYLSPGNINLSGAGATADGDFTGDVVSSIRYIKPADHGLDCSAGTIVIRIQTPGTPSVYNEQTGQLVTRGDMGTGTVTIE